MTLVHVPACVYRGISLLGLYWSPSIWISGIKILPSTISMTHEMGLLSTTCQNKMSVHQPGDGKQTLHQAASHVTFAVLKFWHCRVRLWFNSLNPGTKVYLAHSLQKGVCSEGLKSKAQGQTAQFTWSIISYWTNPGLHHSTLLRKDLTKLWIYWNVVTNIFCWNYIWLTRLFTLNGLCSFSNFYSISSGRRQFIPKWSAML